MALRRLATIAFAAGLAACNAAGPTGSGGGSPAAASDRPSPVPTIALPAPVSVESLGGVAFDKTGQADWLQVAGGSVWAAGGPAADELGRLDP